MHGQKSDLVWNPQAGSWCLEDKFTMQDEKQD